MVQRCGGKPSGRPSCQQHSRWADPNACVAYRSSIMLLPISKSTRQFLSRILWCGTLFATSGRCATDAADFPTSEVLIIATPVRPNLVTRTVTITIAYKPTLAPGDSSYGLCGCYGHTGIDQRGGHPFGTEQDYATPSSVDLAKLTVASCLDGCATMPREPNTNDRFDFAGLKNGRFVYMPSARGHSCGCPGKRY